MITSALNASRRQAIRSPTSSRTARIEPQIPRGWRAIRPARLCRRYRPPRSPERRRVSPKPLAARAEWSKLRKSPPSEQLRTVPRDVPKRFSRHARSSGMGRRYKRHFAENQVVAGHLIASADASRRASCMALGEGAFAASEARTRLRQAFCLRLTWRWGSCLCSFKQERREHAYPAARGNCARSGVDEEC